MRLRDYQAGDADEIARLFTETIREINRRDYTPEQIRAWAPQPYDLARWQQKLDRSRPLVAETDGAIVGFSELEGDGHIDCFYVHKDWQGRGVGRLMADELERRALAANLPRLFAEASITARPFFERLGFRALARQEVVARGVSMANYRMEKVLADG